MCPYIQQNGIFERKNQQVFEVAHLSMFATRVPIHFRGKTVLTTSYLIMPTRILNFQTPLSAFTQIYPQTKLFTSLPLKVLSCMTFIHLHNHLRSKLDPWVVKCIFLGYSPTQKGYKCYDPTS